MDTGSKYRFDPVDHNFMRIRGRLSPGERLLAMLAARDSVMGAQRARLRRQYPDLSLQEINLKAVEEIERADPEQMRRSIRMGISFNIIDGKRGEKTARDLYGD